VTTWTPAAGEADAVLADEVVVEEATGVGLPYWPRVKGIEQIRSRALRVYMALAMMKVVRP
jgi:hypothetical protein